MQKRHKFCEQAKKTRDELCGQIEQFSTDKEKFSLCDNLIEFSLGLFARSRERSWQLCDNERRYFLNALKVIEKFASEQQREMMCQKLCDIFKEMLRLLSQNGYQLASDHYKTMLYCLEPIPRIGALEHFQEICRVFYPAVSSIPLEESSREPLKKLFNSFIRTGAKRERFDDYIRTSTTFYSADHRQNRRTAGQSY